MVAQDQKLKYTPVQSIPGIVSKVKATYLSGRTRPLQWRMAQLKALKNLITENQSEIVTAVQNDLGRHAMEATIPEIGGPLGQVGYFLANLPALMKDEVVSTKLQLKPASYYISREPFGAILLLCPWNFPVELVLTPLAGMIATGNAVVIKPSEVASHVAEVLGRLIPQYLDTSAIQVVQGGKDETTRLLQEKFDHIMYTGGTEVGKIVMKAAAEHLTPVTLELGGKSPAYVCENANLAVTARRLMYGKCFNAGQICIAPDYVLANRKVVDKLVEELKKAAVMFYTENPQKSDSFARLVNERHFDRVKSYLDEDHGGKIVHGGKTDRDNKFIEPTLVLGPRPDSKLMTEEIFGPVMPIVPVEGLQEAMDFVNARPTPLAAYIFTESAVTRDQWTRRVNFGGGAVNEVIMHLANDNCPFGGKGDSGVGYYRGKWSFEQFTHKKTVMLAKTSIDPLARYPPYKEETLAFLMKILTFRPPTWWKPAAGAVGLAIAAVLVAVLMQHVNVNVAWK